MNKTLLALSLLITIASVNSVKFCSDVNSQSSFTKEECLNALSIEGNCYYVKYKKGYGSKEGVAKCVLYEETMADLESKFGDGYTVLYSTEVGEKLCDGSSCESCNEDASPSLSLLSAGKKCNQFKSGKKKCTYMWLNTYVDTEDAYACVDAESYKELTEDDDIYEPSNLDNVLFSLDNPIIKSVHIEGPDASNGNSSSSKYFSTLGIKLLGLLFALLLID